MPANTAYLIRTNNGTVQTRHLLQTLNSAFPSRVFPIVHVTDRRQVPDLPNAILMDDAMVAGWGFTQTPDNWGWLCGDFCYYAGFDALPKFDRYCLIEDDVALTSSAATKLDTLLSEAGDQVLACGLHTYRRIRNFSRDLGAIGVDPAWGCQFPLTSMTRDQVAQVRQVRAKAQAVEPAIKLNDEAVLAATVVLNDLPHRDLYDAPDLFNEACFNTHPPFIIDTETWQPVEDVIHHPVITLGKALSRIRTGERGFTQGRLNKAINNRCAPHIAKSLKRALDANEHVSPDKEVRHKDNDPANRLNRMARLISMLPSYEPLRIVDVGANPVEGDPEYTGLLQHGQCHVIGFEPQAEAMEALQVAASPFVTYLPHIVGDGREMTFHETQYSGFSSTLAPDETNARYLGFARSMRVKKTTSLPSSRLDDIAEIGEVDLLRMDVQGGETAVLAGASHTLASTLAIQTEARFLPIYKEEPSFGALHDALTGFGFNFHCWLFQKRVKTVHRYRSYLSRRAPTQIVDGDAVYVRGLTNLTSESSPRLAKLAVMADCIFDSFDLTLNCLGVLVDRGELTDQDVFQYIHYLPAGLLRKRPVFDEG